MANPGQQARKFLQSGIAEGLRIAVAVVREASVVQFNKLNDPAAASLRAVANTLEERMQIEEMKVKGIGRR